MSPATYAGGVQTVYWTRSRVIEKIKRWVDLYGEPPRAADWNPSSAKYSAQTWRVERYEKGDPDTGESWPSLNAAKKAFPDPKTGKPSLTAAVVAAGFEPNRSGPPKRVGVLDMDDPALVGMHPKVRAALAAARQEAREARLALEVRERQLADARSRVSGLREDVEDAKARARVASARPSKTTVKTKTKVRTKVVRERVMDPRMESALSDARERLADLTAEVKAARRDAVRTAAKLERAEATINTLREDRRALRADVSRLEGRGPEVVERVVPRVERVEVLVPAPEKEVLDEALRERDEAVRARAVAESCAADAQHAYRQLAEAVTGESRKLTPAEMAELRVGGPSGPAVLADALRELASARRVGGKQPLKVALRKVASAAVRWQDRV